ncbi:MAG: sugar transferase [Thermodesulfobacteriota bacterium]
MIGARAIGRVCDAPYGRRGPVRLAIKRIFDMTFAAAALVVLSPVMLIAAWMVKRSGPGPVFYRGVRAGMLGIPFRIFKFRTMVTNAELLGGPTTGTNDPRVTPIGAFLRRTKLDELPQFINVLAGQMSLVGPRPEVLEYTDQYRGEEKSILSMRPGITDYASVEFADLDDLVGSEDPDGYFRKNILPHKNALRIKYVREWSLVSDFRILWATLHRVLKKLVA